jgi:hypothetical protein
VTKMLPIPLAAVALLAAVASIAAAQDKPAPPPKRNPVPVNVQVVISRYQGDKKISSMPYTLLVTANGRPTSLRMGAKVPVSQMMFSQGKDMPGPQAAPVSYHDVGTNIDCDAGTAEDGRFVLNITVSDSSVYGEDDKSLTAKMPGNPTFKSFTLTNSAVLRDGQSTQFTAATDKVNGEVTKIDVTLTVVK